MECSAYAAIERRGWWCRTSEMTPAVIGFWRQGGAGAVMPVVEIWRRRASPCGRFDGRDRVNGARIEGAQVRRQAAVGARASAEQQIVEVASDRVGKGAVAAVVWVGGGGIVV